MRPKKLNKRGATTVFTAIILSSIILIECTYVTFVWDLDRRLCISRALKDQVEVILADYDRALFDTYGIYAFDINRVDDNVFTKVLEANGLKNGDSIYIDQIEVMDTEALRCAITSYYAYRGGAIAIKAMIFQVSSLLDKVIDTKVTDKIKLFSSSGAAGIVANILLESSDIEEKIDSYATEIEESLLEKGQLGLRNLQKLIDDSNDDVTSFDPGLRLTDLGFLTFKLTSLEHMIDLGKSLIAGKGDHLLLAHYAAYNFDCAVDNEVDCTINGTLFSSIHENNYYDAEYILTGIDGRPGMVSVSSLIFQIMFCKYFLENYTDEGKALAYETAAILLTTVVALISECTVDIPAEVMQMIIIAIVSVCQAAKAVNDCLKGEALTLFEEDGMELIKLKYRDFLFLYLCCVNDASLSKRMLGLLTRDYGDLYTGIKLSTEYRGTTYDITRKYELYE